MNLAGRLSRLEKASAARGGGSCPLCGAGGELQVRATFAEPGEKPLPRPGCPRCGSGAVYVARFNDAREAHPHRL